MSLSPEEVLARVPQQRPMRFLDEIREVDAEHLLASYTWKEEDCAGHFPGNPIVPGVKLLEMCAQAGNVAWGIYLMSLEKDGPDPRGMVGVFTEVDRALFKRVVRPGEMVAAFAQFGEEGYFRGGKLVSEVEIQFEGGAKDGETVLTARTSGMWVPASSESLR